MPKVAESTVRRLSLYLRFLEEFEGQGIATVSSGALASRGGTTSAQVRKDLSFFGSFGKRGLGYPVPELADQLREILGLKRRYRAVPFFWTEQFGIALRYVGQGRGFDEVRIDGEIERGDFIARYFAQGVHRASAAVGRDLEILEDERRLEDAASARTAGANSDLLTPSCLA